MTYPPAQHDVAGLQRATPHEALPDTLTESLNRLLGPEAVRYRRLWAYYLNPMEPRALAASAGNCERPYMQAQEWGLPSRITGYVGGEGISDMLRVEQTARKEVVVENDIGWRIDTMVDYALGHAFTFSSLAPEARGRHAVERLMHAVFANAGGHAFWQKLGLLAAVYGFVDVLVKLNEPAVHELTRRLEAAGDHNAAEGTANTADVDDETVTMLAACIRLEVVEAPRALPVLSEDAERPTAYAQVWRLTPEPAGGERRDRSKPPTTPSAGWLRRWLPSRQTAEGCGVASSSHQLGRTDAAVELLTAAAWYRYEYGRLVARGTHVLGELPLVHMQNLAMPFSYAGASDVEPLIPLQDELNTRLSDRGYRIAMQSFKMFLGRGIENFGQLAIGPGQMWMTENESASIVEFGGDTASPGETQHIAEVREALDKASGVNAVAAGAIKERVGNLTSAAALRVTMLALVIRTQRKRASFEVGINQMSRLSLLWLERAGLLEAAGLAGLSHTPQLDVHWPGAIPASLSERLREAKDKLALGVPRDTVLKELGYEQPAGESNPQANPSVPTPIVNPPDTAKPAEAPAPAEAQVAPEA
ncbi:MAG: hypothetical protein ACFCVE_01965 [Phycisphaerae bacterium]